MTFHFLLEFQPPLEYTLNNFRSTTRDPPMAMDLSIALAEAEEAYHKLMMGEQVIMIRDSNGEQIQYANASSSKLAAYIASLRIQLGIATTTGPMRTWMGP